MISEKEFLQFTLSEVRRLEEGIEARISKIKKEEKDGEKRTK